MSRDEQEWSFRLRVYGAIGLTPEFKNGLATRIQKFLFRQPCVVVEDPRPYPREIRGELFDGVDALFCRIPDGSDRAVLIDCLLFIKEVFSRFPFLPVLVFGHPDEIAEDDSEKLFRAVLGAARILRSGDDIEQIIAAAGEEGRAPRPLLTEQLLDPFDLLAYDCAQAIQSHWWWGVRWVGLPITIVDRRHRILRVNEAAASRFGQPMTGASYAERVAGLTRAELPAEHPIRQAFEDGAGVGRYSDYAVGGFHRSVYLVCEPIFGTRSHRASAVAVLHVETDPWAWIYRASEDLGQASDLPDLQRRIVRHISDVLGYRRARLYRYLESPDGGLLRGIESVGLVDPVHEVEFRTRFSLRLSEDVESRSTIKEWTPILFVYYDTPEDFEKHQAGQPDDRYYVQPVLRKRDHALLEKDGVGKWIDIPLLVPAPGLEHGTKPSVWGKISVDRGPGDSDHLTDRDAPRLGLFANVVGAALAGMERKERDLRQARALALSHRYTQAFAQAVWRQPEDAILPRIRELLLEMFQELIEASGIAFYDYVEVTHRLHLVRKKVNPPAEEPPEWKSLGDGGSAELLEQFIAAEREHDPFQRIEPCIREDAGVETLCIPIVVAGRPRGIIGAIRMGSRFDAELVRTVSLFADLASVFYEFGEQHDGRLWWDGEVLRRLVAKMTEKLDSAVDDEIFYAYLGAFLTAGNGGMAWNRCMVFLTDPGGLGRVELKWAIGGHGDERQGEIMQAVLERYPQIDDILNELSYTRRPGGPRGADLDPLYRVAVEQPRQAGRPIRMRYDGSASTGEDAPVSRLIGSLLTRDPLIPPQRPGPSVVGPSEASAGLNPAVAVEPEWRRAMDARWPGLFPREWTTYAFPLWGVPTISRQPLGLVLVDMPNEPLKRLAERIPATWFVLQIAAERLAIRRQRELMSRLYRILPAVSHGPGLESTWNNLVGRWNVLRDTLEGEPRPLSATTGKEPPDLPGPALGNPVGEPLDSFKIAWEQFKKQLAPYLQAERDEATPVDPARPATDIRTELEKIASSFRTDSTDKLTESGSLAVSIDVVNDDGIGSQLPLPSPVLGQVLGHLIRNATRAARQDGRSSLRIELRTRAEETRSPQLGRVVMIEVANDGPPIAPGDAGQVFLDGFTYDAVSEDGKNKTLRGRGLGLVRFFLANYRADIQLSDPGGRQAGAAVAGPTHLSCPSCGTPFSDPPARPDDDATSGQTAKTMTTFTIRVGIPE